MKYIIDIFRIIKENEEMGDETEMLVSHEIGYVRMRILEFIAKL